MQDATSGEFFKLNAVGLGDAILEVSSGGLSCSILAQSEFKYRKYYVKSSEILTLGTLVQDILCYIDEAEHKGNKEKGLPKLYCVLQIGRAHV